VLLSQDKYFDNYLGSEDNALFFKNAIYWLTDLDVPSFTRDIPTVFDVEDRIALLNSSVDSIAQDLAEVANDIGNISSIDEIAEDVAGLDAGYEETSSSLADLSTSVTQLQEQITELSESVSGFQEIVGEIGDASDIVDLKNRLSVLTSQLEVLENELHSQQPQGGTDLLLYLSPIALVVAVIAIALTIKK
jgi:prefoldin subunit 5